MLVFRSVSPRFSSTQDFDDAETPDWFATFQEISNRTHVSRTPKKPEYLIALQLS